MKSDAATGARPARTLPYEAVKASLRGRIAEGGWRPGVRLPSDDTQSM